MWGSELILVVLEASYCIMKMDGWSYNEFLALRIMHALCRYGVNAKQYFEEYLPGPKRTVFHTKKGLSWRNAWGVLRYSANNAFLAFVHSAQMKEQVGAWWRLTC